MKRKKEGIYPVEDDSIFLSEILKEEIPKKLEQKRDLKVLDMGSGSGIQAKTCIDSGIKEENIILIDINKNAVKKLKENFKNSKVFYSNLFSKIPRKEKFDLIMFNPPYLPKNRFDNKLDTTGGKYGSEIINKFLRKAKKYGKKKFSIILLTSSLTKRIDFGNYKKRLIAEKNLFFEKLFIWELK